MHWIVVSGAALLALYLLYRRGDRRLSKKERDELRKLLEAAAREQAEEPFERYTLDIGQGPEVFAIGEADGVAFKLSREVRVPRLRGRRYWLFLPGDTLDGDRWFTFFPKGEFARLIDRILDAPAPSLKEDPPAEAKAEEAAPSPSEPAPPAPDASPVEAKAP